ncbi:MAG: hypothetical protein ACR2RL_24590, partial [Gammaproteobacteria bacterium]
MPNAESTATHAGPVRGAEPLSAGLPSSLNGSNMKAPGYADTAAQHGIDSTRSFAAPGPLRRWLRPREVQDYDRWLARKLLQLCGAPPVRLLLWNGEAVTWPG